MAKPAKRKNRSKLAVALLAPILVIVFIVGWALYWVGRPRTLKAKQQQATINTTLERGSVELYAIPPQEKEVLAN